MHRSVFNFGLAVAYLATFASITGFTFSYLEEYFGSIWWAVIAVIFASAVTYWVGGQLSIFSSLATRRKNLALSKHLIDTAQNNITIIGGDISWVPELAPAIKEAVQTRGKTVQVFCRSPRFSEQREGVNRLAEHCGATVRYFGDGVEPSTRAVAKDLDHPEILEFSRIGAMDRPPMLARWIKNVWTKILRNIDEDANDEIYLSRRYTSESSEAHKVCDLVRILAHITRPATVMRAVDFGDLAKLLGQSVEQYAGRKIHMSRIDISRLHPICAYLDTTRYERVRQLVRAYQDEGFQPFDPIKILDMGRYRIITPPIVEMIGDRYYVIDGTHRVFAARNLGVSELTVMVVNNPSSGLPAQPISWSDVVVSSEQVSRSHNFKGFKESRWRHLSRYHEALEDLKLSGSA